MKKLLSIAIATYDDYDGTFFTIQALRIYHPICQTDDVEFVVLDGNPNKDHGKEVKKYVNGIPGAKYIERQHPTTSSFDKYKTIEHCEGKYILILDCHVLLEPGSIDYLLQYYNNNPNCKNLVQGPLLYDDLKNYSTHFKPGWRGMMYGTWETNQEEYLKGEPFEIPMQGMGLCSFEKENWPGIGVHFKGFGGEEGYIAEKFRQNGGKNICIPQLRWNHRFNRPNGVPYRLIVEDRIWNYFVGWLELTKDPKHEVIRGAYEHFKDKIPEGSIDTILRNAIETIL